MPSSLMVVASVESGREGFFSFISPVVCFFFKFSDGQRYVSKSWWWYVDVFPDEISISTMDALRGRRFGSLAPFFGGFRRNVGKGAPRWFFEAVMTCGEEETRIPRQSFLLRHQNRQVLLRRGGPTPEVLGYKKREMWGDLMWVDMLFVDVNGRFFCWRASPASSSSTYSGKIQISDCY
ncbi:Uncharacterized protein Rs2_16494 [Raphanus sativus]|nr:Uncharacterized protein Rs2_16494 [Raphanus sativus]